MLKGAHCLAVIDSPSPPVNSCFIGVSFSLCRVYLTGFLKFSPSWSFLSKPFFTMGKNTTIWKSCRMLWKVFVGLAFLLYLFSEICMPCFQALRRACMQDLLEQIPLPPALIFSLKKTFMHELGRKGTCMAQMDCVTFSELRSAEQGIFKGHMSWSAVGEQQGKGLLCGDPTALKRFSPGRPTCVCTQKVCEDKAIKEGS